MSREMPSAANAGGPENPELNPGENPESVEGGEPAVGEEAAPENVEAPAEVESPEKAVAETVEPEPVGEKTPEEAWDGALDQGLKNETEGKVEAEKPPEERLLDIGGRLSANEAGIKKLRGEIEAERQRINELRGELGGGGEASQETSSMRAKQEQLDELVEEKGGIEKEKAEVETEQDLEGVFVVFVEMKDKGDKEGLKKIAETGLDKEGKPFKTKDGKEVSPDAAKKMAEAALKGIKNLTAFIVKAMIAVVKGIFQGIAEGIKG